ncbi:hypothetical protein QEH54_07030 [Pelagicoccus sp. SDUM812003]|nr:hypothetical protein [Pelagicoccus sp. SDUM812003]
MSSNPKNRIHLYITIAMTLLSVFAGLLSTLSYFSGTLYYPWGPSETTSPEAAFYLGISVYITLAVTLLTSALIRIALRITR